MVARIAGFTAQSEKDVLVVFVFYIFSLLQMLPALLTAAAPEVERRGRRAGGQQSASSLL